MKKLTIALALCVSLLVLVSTVAQAGSPPLPSRFYGEITLNGDDAPTGLTLSAWIDGVQYAETSITVAGGHSVYVIDVPADDPDTPGLEGGQNGDAVVFKLGGHPARHVVVCQRIRLG